MKRILLTLVVLGIACFTAGAADFTKNTQLTFGTNQVASTATNTVRGTIWQCPEDIEKACIWIKTYGNHGAVVADGVVYNLGFGFRQLQYGTNTISTNIVYRTEPDVTITVTPDGSTNVWARALVDLSGVDYVVPLSIINISGATVTNEAWISWHERR